MAARKRAFPWRLRVGNAQHPGTRAEQQDDFGFSRLNQKKFAAHGGVMATLTDGMGGMARGGEAGRLAKETMLQAYQRKTPQESISQALQRSLAQANQAVVGLAREAGRLGGIGTTLVAAVIQGEYLHWISVGDSRIYLYRRGGLTQLTEDHDYGLELVEQAGAGQLTLAEVQAHSTRERGALISYLGQPQLARIDRNLRPFQLEAGDRLLLCSDGLFATLSEEEMAGALAGDPQQAAETLVDLAVGKNFASQDNVTVAILACDPETPRRRRLLAPVLWLGLLVGLLLGGMGYLTHHYLGGGEEAAVSQSPETPGAEMRPAAPEEAAGEVPPLLPQPSEPQSLAPPLMRPQVPALADEAAGRPQPAIQAAKPKTGQPPGPTRKDRKKLAQKKAPAAGTGLPSPPAVSKADSKNKKPFLKSSPSQSFALPEGLPAIIPPDAVRTGPALNLARRGRS